MAFSAETRLIPTDLVYPSFGLLLCLENFMTIFHPADTSSCFQQQLRPLLPTALKLSPSSALVLLFSIAQNDLACLEGSKALCLNVVTYVYFHPPRGLLSYFLSLNKTHSTSTVLAPSKLSINSSQVPEKLFPRIS